MQIHPRLLFEGWSDRIITGYFQIVTSGELLESRYVSDMQIISNLWVAIYAFSRNIFA